MVYAGGWRRLLAMLLDGVVLGVLNNGAIFGLGALCAATNMDLSGSALQGLLVVVDWLYFALLESSGQQATFGKMALGIKVTTLDGGRIDFGRATGRHFGKILSAIPLLIGFLIVDFTQRKQTLHDMLSGCLVVRR